jgi:hypothetical protein
MSCLLRLPTPLPSNLKALFASRNRLRALTDTVVLLAGRCYIGHKNASRLHVHGNACMLVAATQDVALAKPGNHCYTTLRKRDSHRISTGTLPVTPYIPPPSTTSCSATHPPAGYSPSYWLCSGLPEPGPV